MKFLRKLLVPLFKFFSLFHRSYTETTEEGYLKLKEMAQDFDVLLSETDVSLSNLGIEGKYKHVGVLRKGYVYEATTHGVVRTGLEEWFFKKDKVGMVRPRFCLWPSEGEKYLEAQIGKPYDFEMDAEDESKLYCSELVFNCFSKMNPMDMKGFNKSSKLVIYPMDFWENEHLFLRKFET